MNKMLLGLMVTASVVANAQSSSTTAVAPAAQTSTVSAADTLAAGIKPWSAGVYLGLNTMGSDIDAGNAVGSLNYLEVGYQLNPNYKLNFRHNFSYSFNGSNDASDNYGYVDPEIQLKTKLSPIGTSSPVAIGLRYYLPMTSASMQSDRAGVLRTDISAEWALTPKFALGAYVSPRITFNNKGGTTGAGTADSPTRPTNSDDVIRMVVSPSATYSFNDKVNTYYAPALDYATTELAHGKATPRGGLGIDNLKYNYLSHEVGATFQVGKVSINPAVINYTDLTSGDHGYGKAERMEYDINVSATF